MECHSLLLVESLCHPAVRAERMDVKESEDCSGRARVSTCIGVRERRTQQCSGRCGRHAEEALSEPNTRIYNWEIFGGLRRQSLCGVPLHWLILNIERARLGCKELPPVVFTSKGYVSQHPRLRRATATLRYLLRNYRPGTSCRLIQAPSLSHQGQLT